MSLLQFREKIHTDCSQLGYSTLNIGGIKIDASSTCSLKNTVHCSAMASCDYIKKRKSKIYFIEISDLKYEIKNYISSGCIKKDAYKKCKTGLRTKFSEMKHIYDEMLKNFEINKNCSKHAIIAICQGTQSDIIALSQITNSLKQHHVPVLYTDMKLIIYSDLEKL